LDAADDPLHGHQEARFFHGYYRNLPLYIFCVAHLLRARSVIFHFQTLKIWLCERCFIGKAENLAKGDNQRFVMTSLPADGLATRAVYEQLYCASGDIENRVKEKQQALFADRASTQQGLLCLTVQKSQPIRVSMDQIGLNMCHFTRRHSIRSLPSDLRPVTSLNSGVSEGRCEIGASRQISPRRGSRSVRRPPGSG
jgi:hypothetical protein